MAEEIISAELQRHLKSCTKCHDPNKDGGDAVYCEDAEMLFRAMRASLHHGFNPVLVH